ncbi:MAG: dihydroorotase family protein [Candidatus Heimdallarchaeota archaeon]
MDLMIEGGKIVLPDKTVEGAIAIDDGKIRKVGKEPTLPRADKIIRIPGKLVFPGLIDIHVHLRDLELSYKEDFTTGTQAAVVSGITTLLDMPNTKPLTNSLTALKAKKKVAQKKILVDTGFFSLLPKQLSEIEEILREGIAGFKIFPHNPYTTLRLTLENLKEVFTRIDGKKPLAIHPDLSTNGEANINRFLTTHSNKQEAQAIKWVGRILTKRDRLHICHVSVHEAIQEIISLKTKGLNVSCEVTPHHLFLTQDALLSKKGIAKMLPPLRTKEDVVALHTAMKKGIINAIASDHAPHLLKEKAQSFAKAPSGIPGLETLLILTLDYALKENFPLHHLGRLLSTNPAIIYGLPNKGGIVAGRDADLVIIDPKTTHQIDASKFISKAKYSPFDGYQVKITPIMTLIRGTIACEDNEILVPPGFGKLISGTTPREVK